MEGGMKVSDIYMMTRRHQIKHRCGAYVFDDGDQLSKLMQSLQPKRILELGCAIGYTAACMATGAPDATVHTIEADPIHVEIARKNFEEMGFSNRVFVYPGKFEDVMRTLPDQVYDVAFFDGFSPTVELVSAMRRTLRSGGVLICANVMLSFGDERLALHREFSDAARWRLLATLENGGTLAMEKM